MADNNFCINCGHAIPTTERFCGKCGTENKNYSIPNEKPIQGIDILNKPLPMIELMPLLEFEKHPRNHKEVPASQLSNVLKSIEKKKGRVYQDAKEFLLNNLPIDAIEPLWKMKGKIFFDDSKKEDLYLILGEIGTKSVVELITRETPYNSDILEYLKIIIKNRVPEATKWLGDVTKTIQDFPFNILAMMILQDRN